MSTQSPAKPSFAQPTKPQVSAIVTLMSDIVAEISQAVKESANANPDGMSAATGARIGADHMVAYLLGMQARKADRDPELAQAALEFGASVGAATGNWLHLIQVAGTEFSAAIVTIPGIPQKES